MCTNLWVKNQNLPSRYTDAPSKQISSYTRTPGFTRICSIRTPSTPVCSYWRAIICGLPSHVSVAPSQPFILSRAVVAQQIEPCSWVVVVTLETQGASHQTRATRYSQSEFGSSMESIISLAARFARLRSNGVPPSRFGLGPQSLHLFCARKGRAVVESGNGRPCGALRSV